MSLFNTYVYYTRPNHYIKLATLWFLYSDLDVHSKVPGQIAPLQIRPHINQNRPKIKKKIMIVIIIIISFDNEKITVHVIGNIV
jgi:hypothetical protein